jgi:hypothetical protein
MWKLANCDLSLSVFVIAIALENRCSQGSVKPNCYQSLLCRRGRWNSVGKSRKSVSFICHLMLLLTKAFSSDGDKLVTESSQPAPLNEIEALKTKLYRTLEEIRGKSSKLTVHDLRRLLFRCAATLISLGKV